MTRILFVIPLDRNVSKAGQCPIIGLARLTATVWVYRLIKRITKGNSEILLHLLGPASFLGFVLR